MQTTIIPWLKEESDLWCLLHNIYFTVQHGRGFVLCVKSHSSVREQARIPQPLLSVWEEVIEAHSNVYYIKELKLVRHFQKNKSQISFFFFTHLVFDFFSHSHLSLSPIHFDKTLLLRLATLQTKAFPNTHFA